MNKLALLLSMVLVCVCSVQAAPVHFQPDPKVGDLLPEVEGLGPSRRSLSRDDVKIDISGIRARRHYTWYVTLHRRKKARTFYLAGNLSGTARPHLWLSNSSRDVVLLSEQPDFQYLNIHTFYEAIPRGRNLWWERNDFRDPIPAADTSR